MGFGLYFCSEPRWQKGLVAMMRAPGRRPGCKKADRFRCLRSFFGRVGCRAQLLSSESLFRRVPHDASGLAQVS